MTWLTEVFLNLADRFYATTILDDFQLSNVNNVKGFQYFRNPIEDSGSEWRFASCQINTAFSLFKNSF